MSTSKTIYLAGFDVFRPDAVAHGQRLQALCAEFGHTGLFPLDNQAPTDLHGEDLAMWIYRANIALIQRSDVLLANLANFRGHEPDSGTAFEVGYAAALNKPVWGYTDDGRPLVRQVPCTESQDRPGSWVDAQGFAVEDFGLPRNLMLHGAGRILVGGPRVALEAMQENSRRG